eukprot:gene31577-56369_t
MLAEQECGVTEDVQTVTIKSTHLGCVVGNGSILAFFLLVYGAAAAAAPC